MDGYKVIKNGTTLIIELGKALNTANAPALQEELTKYIGQDIEKVYFDASELLILSSSGLRVVFFAKQRLGNKPEIAFVNCAREIYNVLKTIGLAPSIKFLKAENRKIVHSQMAFDDFAAHNDVVCYSMKLGECED